MNMDFKEFCSKGGKARKGTDKAHRAKLSPRQVKAIRASKKSAAVLAMKFKVHYQTIYRVRNRKLYAYIP